MPHLVLEYSENLPAPVDLQALFARLHEALRAEGFALERMKSRALPCAVFRVGVGDPVAVFAHLTVAILAGRDPETRRRVAERLLGVLREAFATAWAERPCDLTVDVREMERATYVKAMNPRAGGPG